MTPAQATAAVVKALDDADVAAFSYGDSLKRTNWPAAYSQIHVTERTPPALRLDATTASRAYRVVVKSYARLYDDAVDQVEKVRAALLWQSLPTTTPAGPPSDPSAWTSGLAPSLEREDPIDTEGDWFVHATELVFSA